MQTFSLRSLVRDVQLPIPKWVVNFALKFVRSSVKSRAGFDLNKLKPIVHAKNCYAPAMFAVAEEDTFIRPRHSKKLSKASFDLFVNSYYFWTKHLNSWNLLFGKLKATFLQTKFKSPYL